MEAELSFEEAMNRLNNIVSDLESGKLSLDQALKLYREGSELVNHCSNQLNNAKLEVQKITEMNGQLVQEPFETDLL